MKPHIRLSRYFQGLWICYVPRAKRPDGVGRTPKEAYDSWQKSTTFTTLADAQCALIGPTTIRGAP